MPLTEHQIDNILHTFWRRQVNVMKRDGSLYKGELMLHEIGMARYRVGKCPHWFQWNDIRCFVIHHKGTVVIHLRRMPDTRLIKR